MGIVQYISLFVFTLMLLLGILVLAHNPQKKINIAFFLLTFCFVIWVSANFMVDISGSNKENLLLWGKIAIVGPIFMPLALFYFSSFFSKKNIQTQKFEKWMGIFLLITVFVECFFVPTRFNISDVIMNKTPPEFQMGYLYASLFITVLVGIASSIYILIKKIKFSDKQERNQIFFLAIGFIITIIVGTLTEIVLTYFNAHALTSIGPSISVIIIIFSAVAIIKYASFNINFIITEILVYGLLIFMVISSLPFKNNIDIIIKSFIFFAVVIISYFLIRNMILEMERKKQVQELANELKNANDELKKLDQLKDDFVHLTVHEINTPMTSILGYLSMILDEKIAKVDEKAEEYLQKVYNSSKRLADVVANFLDTVKIEGGKLKLEFTKVKMEELFQEIIMEYEEKAKAKNNQIKIQSLGLNKNAEVEVDRDKIKEAFINLIDNAIKFTDNGLIAISINTDKDECKIYIEDNGIGIPPEKLEKIFEKFYQATPNTSQYPGTGLGLYITKSLIDMHGGSIKIESIMDKGAKFIVSLPLKR